MSKKAIKDRPQKQQPKEKIRLSRAEKKQIAAIMRQAKGDGKKHTAQQTIPYETMYPDGICRVKDNLFSKSIEFSDINYQLAQPDDKTATFEALCDFYNSLDSSVGLQLTFVNRVAGEGDFAKSIAIPPQQDGFDDVREEYAAMLQNQPRKNPQKRKRRQSRPKIISPRPTPTESQPSLSFGANTAASMTAKQ